MRLCIRHIAWRVGFRTTRGTEIGYAQDMMIGSRGDSGSLSSEAACNSQDREGQDK